MTPVDLESKASRSAMTAACLLATVFNSRTQQLGIISPRTASTLGRGSDSSNTDCIASTHKPA
ncbi:hypothetical protein EYF80_033248 [Liparis tanakae]|uniref:Uncharacterized protein n=1 Tax=Liparis tanakae TaxID=230148 RepID=A0A4Z2GUV7_9TELE|nr:hypothetical protein EYF80_033248 [Liparis tanakae]